MKNVKFLLVFLAMFLISGIAFGQSFTFVKDFPVGSHPPALKDKVTVEVLWHREDGVVLSNSIVTTTAGITGGVTVNIPSYPGIYADIISTQIIVDFYGGREMHYAVYPGFVSQAIRANDPQYWIVQ